MALSRDAEGRAVLGGLLLRSLLDRPGLPTPFYAYDVDAMVEAAARLGEGFGDRDHLVCYAVKANTAGTILRRFARAGVGADVVSGGELAVCLGAGIAPRRVVWSGVAKTDGEIDQALTAGGVGILSLHLESIEEVARVEARAKALGCNARISFRINPSVDADTHAHIATGHDEAKFGVPLADVGGAMERVVGSDHITLVGLSVHVGSQMTTPDAYVAGAEVLVSLARTWESRGPRLELLDLGGGMGIDYGEGCAAEPRDFARAGAAVVARAGFSHAKLLCEPGRALVASHGVVVARSLLAKRWSRKETAGWLFLDAGMTDLLRPALYGARHRIEPLHLDGSAEATWRVGGPVCESTDDFGTFQLPDPPPDAVVIRDAGAYGYTMASQYNGRSLPAEAFIEGGEVTHVTRERDVDAWVKARLA